VTISRFYRDRAVFAAIGGDVLPRLASRVPGVVRCWSAGCASGEEAYTMSIIWELRGAQRMEGKSLHVLGTDTDPALLERARRAEYAAGSLKELPEELAERAFDRREDMFVLRGHYKRNVRFEKSDIMKTMPAGLFDMILCRNLAFTYFGTDLQAEVARGLAGRLAPGGVLVVGIHESLPPGVSGLEAEAPAIYRRIE
jgi:chemotaxis protein methyltransferase CheR